MATAQQIPPYTATTSNPRFYRSNFMSPVTLPDGEVFLNIFDPRIRKLILSISSASSYQYRDTDKLTGIALQVYGSVSLWWVLQLYNAGFHPLEIAQGTTLLIPNSFEVFRAVSDYTNVTNNVVTL